MHGVAVMSPDGSVVLDSETTCYKLHGIYTSFVDDRPPLQISGTIKGPFFHTHYVDIVAPSMPLCFLQLPFASSTGNSLERTGLALSHIENISGSTWRVYITASYNSPPAQLFAFVRIGATEQSSEAWGLRVFAANSNRLFDSGFRMLHTVGPGETMTLGRSYNPDTQLVSFAQGSHFLSSNFATTPVCMSGFTRGPTTLSVLGGNSRVSVYRVLFSYGGSDRIEVRWTLVCHQYLTVWDPHLYQAFSATETNISLPFEFIRREDFM